MLSVRTSVEIKYKNTNISPSILSWEYTDNLAGHADELNIQVENSKSLWNGPWAPERGAILSSDLISQFTGTATRRKLGLFEIDTYSIKKAPKTVKIESLSVPSSSSFRKEGKNRAWEKTTLKRVAMDIAKAHKMKLYYDVDETIELDRVEQTGESDLAFLNELTKQESLALKISNNSIVILDEKKYEAKAAKATINELDKNILDYDFSATLIDVYRSCKVKYQPPKSKKTISYTFTPKNAPKVGRTYVVSKEVKNQAEAKKHAMNQLREKNKDAVRGTIYLSGSTSLIAGDTVNLRGFGKKFDGKYILTQISISKTAKTATILSIRKCLVGY